MKALLDASETTYTCGVCDGTFEKGWSDEEAQAESEKNWPGLRDEDARLVCDDCHNKFMSWYKEKETRA